jgi:hypothetical protein
LTRFEDRHPQAPDRASLKREHSEASTQQPVAGPRQPGPPDHQGGTRPPEHYKELKTFEGRHPPGQDHTRGR